MKKLSLLPLFILFLSCKTTPELKTGIWRATLPTAGGELPFNLEIQKENDGYTVFALNGNEKLKMDKSFIKNDSLHIPMEIFDAEIIAKVEANKLNGIYRKMRSDFSFIQIPFQAEFGKKYRFVEEEKPTSTQIGKKYQVVFRSKNSTDSTLSVGIFSQKNNQLTGTFLTSTGDYRYLQGNIVADSLFLSCFDGNHNFLFKAKIEGDKLSGGGFWANSTGFESWSGMKNDEAQLPDATKLTFLKSGYKTIDFSFKNSDGKSISLKDEAYQNKVVIVQIMGSWCPNCMDESRFLANWYEKNKQKGIEIIGLSYEKSTDPAFAYPKINRLKERFGIDYEVLLAGTNNKDDASKSLPMLNKIIGFPTTIFIDKKGVVREIHTGFSGPGTGKYYDNFVSDFNRLVEKLLME
jgi:thiol-disulfide isomerase/thioredoxin